jgi:hypothetical protein
MNDTEKLESLRNANRDRQQKYYKAHKSQILEKKLKERTIVKEATRVITPIVIPKEFTLEMCIEVFNEHIPNINTKLKYINDLKRVFKLSGIQVFSGTMEEFNSIKKAVESSKYSLSTQRGSIQSLLVFIDHSKIVIDKKVLARYALLLDVAKVKTDDQLIERMNNPDNAVIPYDEYLKLIYEKYPENSKGRIVALLYKEVPCRDDFGSLKLIDSLDEDNGIGNFLLRNCENIILNNYKTKNVYDKVVYDLSSKLSEILLDYIDSCEIKDYLFPEQKPLSAFVISMNKKLGLKISINTLRKMSVSEFLAKANITAEDRMEQSRKMCHSVATQKTYKRKITKKTKKYTIDPSLLQYCDSVNFC